MTHEDSPDPSRRLGRRWHVSRRVVILLAGAIVVIANIVRIAASNEPDPSWIPRDLEPVVSQLLGDGRCITAKDADRRLRADLDDLGYADWTITWEAGVTQHGCVSVGALASKRRMVLIATARPEVKEALRGVAEELRNRCFGKDQASMYIASVLLRLGETDPQVRTDGPIVAQIEEMDAVKRHVEAGCYVYSGVSWSPKAFQSTLSAAVRTSRSTFALSLGYGGQQCQLTTLDLK